MSDVMLSITEFATRNRICRTQVYHEIRAGRLVARKLGRRVLIDPAAEKAWRDALPRLQPTAPA